MLTVIIENFISFVTGVGMKGEGRKKSNSRREAIALNMSRSTIYDISKNGGSYGLGFC